VRGATSADVLNLSIIDGCCAVCVNSELNDDVSDGIVDDGDGPLLLQAILAHDPQALQLSTYHLAPLSGNSGQ